MNFDSSSGEVQAALNEDCHPLARLSIKAFTDGLGDSKVVKSIIKQLLSLKETEDLNDETLDDRPTVRREVT